MTRTLLVMALVVAAHLPVTAQLVTVSEKFRVVEVDRGKERIGIADLDADPKVRQNWVNLKHDTRIYRKNGTDEQPMALEEALETLQPGDLIFVDGGRKWSGRINANTLGILESSGQVAEGAMLPYEPATWKGKVSEVTDSEVIVEVSPEQYVLLPGGLDYGGELKPGSPVEVQLPAGEGELLSVAGKLATLRTEAGLVQVPVSALPRDAKVPVLSKSGASVELPLSTALKLQYAGDGSILASRYHQLSPVGDVSGTGVVLHSGAKNLLIATPDGEVMNLARSQVVVRPGQAIEYDAGGVKKVNKWKSHRKGGKKKIKVK